MDDTAKRNVQYANKKVKPSAASLIYEAIMYDISDRSGVNRIWDNVDDIVMYEIKSTWIETIDITLEEERR